MIQNIKQKKEKIGTLLIFIFIAIVVSAPALKRNQEIAIYDELWNFSNTYKMLNGFMIYKDINVIITPLYFYLGMLILHIFGTNLFAFKIYNRNYNIFTYILNYTTRCILQHFSIRFFLYSEYYYF